MISALKVTTAGDKTPLTIEPTTEAIQQVLGGYVVTASTVLPDGSAVELWCLDECHLTEDHNENAYASFWGLTIFGDVLVTGRADATTIESVPASAVDYK